jgi:hypothetical protein
MLMCLSSALWSYTNPRYPESPSFSAGVRAKWSISSGYTFQLPAFASAGPAFRLRAIHAMSPGAICFPMSRGIPFCTAAVFCRMENHFLNTYNVKFSIHTGGFRG